MRVFFATLLIYSCYFSHAIVPATLDMSFLLQLNSCQSSCTFIHTSCLATYSILSCYFFDVFRQHYPCLPTTLSMSSSYHMHASIHATLSMSSCYFSHASLPATLLMPSCYFINPNLPVTIFMSSCYFILASLPVSLLISSCYFRHSSLPACQAS